MAYWERMFYSDDTPADEDAQRLMRQASPRLVEALQNMGLYVADLAVLQRAGPDGSVQSALQIQAVVGRLAFGPRVQAPDQDAVDARFEEMTDQFVVDEFERRKRELGG